MIYFTYNVPCFKKIISLSAHTHCILQISLHTEMCSSRYSLNSVYHTKHYPVQNTKKTLHTIQYRIQKYTTYYPVQHTKNTTYYPVQNTQTHYVLTSTENKNTLHTTQYRIQKHTTYYPVRNAEHTVFTIRTKSPIFGRSWDFQIGWGRIIRINRKSSHFPGDRKLNRSHPCAIFVDFFLRFWEMFFSSFLYLFLKLFPYH